MPNTYWPDAAKINCPFDGSIAVTKNNLMWSDTAGSLTLQGGTTSTQGKAYPASEMPDQSSAAANQAYFAPRFLGVAAESLTATQTRTTVLVDRTYVGPFTIASGTYYQGDLVTVAELASGTQLSNVKLEKTTTASSAIGRVIIGGTSVTEVTVMLHSRLIPTVMPSMSVTNTAGMVMDDGADIAVNTTTGTKIGTAAAQKLGFWNATPIVQPSGASQAAVNTTVGSAVNTTAATNSTPFGFATNTQADAVVANVNALRVDVLALNTLIHAIRTAMVNAGTMKGSA